MTSDEAIHYAKCLKNNWTLNLNDLGEFCDMAIEALKRKRGEWQVYYDEDSPQDGIWKCSICSYIKLIDDISPTNFCPNCGADMRERREDEQIH